MCTVPPLGLLWLALEQRPGKVACVLDTDANAASMRMPRLHNKLPLSPACPPAACLHLKTKAKRVPLVRFPCPPGPQAYIEAFSQSLDAEVREFGVRVQNQAPLFVATKMSKIRRARLDAPPPAAWAAAAVRQIGREVSASPYWFHALQVGGGGWRRAGMGWWSWQSWGWQCAVLAHPANGIRARAGRAARLRLAQRHCPTPEPPASRQLPPPITDPHPTHPPIPVQIAVIRLAPATLVTSHVLRMHKAMCRAFYRKQARLQAQAAAAAAAGLEDSEAEAEPKKGK